MGLWDSNFKQLVNASPQAFADWLLPGVRVIREISEHLNRTLDVDSLYETVEGTIARRKRRQYFCVAGEKMYRFSDKKYAILYRGEGRVICRR
ncbi:MAG: hypothetical protein JOZ71_05475 [Ktedonobacteraceae bacterium]|nr:hypothetical protein [Ktedonobacteraceae bacterium]